MRIIIPVLLFAFQLGAIVYARFVPTRYFCWAPFDSQTDYTANAVVNGHPLTASEFRQRYRRPRHGFDNRSPQHVIDMLQQVEEKRAKLGEKASVVMEYRVNGKDPKTWRWPSTSTETQKAN
jgi:hypothetical protein